MIKSLPEYIAEYQILGFIASGAHGEVYKALNLDTKKICALKFIANPTDSNELDRIQSEFRNLSQLDHPNIITAHSLIVLESFTFFVMDFIEGLTLHEYIGRNVEPTANLKFHVHLLKSIASAIDYSHSMNILHLDLKPNNIIISNDFTPYVLDFGLPAALEQNTNANYVIGTPAYLTPEQIKKQKLTYKTDLFSFAVIAYEVLSNRRPFTGTDYQEIISSILRKEPNKFPLMISNSLKIDRLFIKALNKHPEERYDSAAELVTELSHLLNVFDANEQNKNLKITHNLQLNSKKVKLSILFFSSILFLYFLLSKAINNSSKIYESNLISTQIVQRSDASFNDLDNTNLIDQVIAERENPQQLLLLIDEINKRKISNIEKITKIYLLHPASVVRLALQENIDYLPNNQKINIYLEGLNDLDPNVRLAALRGLELVSSIKTLSFLENFIKYEEDKIVKENAISVLNKISGIK